MTDETSGDTPGDTPGELTCSAKGCRASAAFELRWNNPRLHSPKRRKTWLACPQHREQLTEFLSARAFLREVVAVPRADR